MSQTLGFTGDVMLGRLVNDHHRGGRPEIVWGSMRDELAGLDGLFMNLECTIATSGTPWNRTPRAFHFRAHPDWAIDALTDVGVDWVTLANNHALDYEVEALKETLDHLDEAGIRVGGAGRTPEEACQPSLVEIGSLRVGLLAVTDNTPEYAVSETQPGTCYTPLGTPARERFSELLAELRASDPDLIVASLHWGPNMTTEPDEARRSLAHWLIGQGVDIIHGHSAHVFHGIEVVDGRPIMYDTGDFVDDYAVDPTLRNDHSFLFTVTLDETGEPVAIELIPTVIENYAVNRANDRSATWCISTMKARSSHLDTNFEETQEGLRLDL